MRPLARGVELEELLCGIREDVPYDQTVRVRREAWLLEPLIARRGRNPGHGRELRTEQLRYDQVRNEISSDSAFTIVRGTDVQRGVKFISDPNLRDFRCLSACSGSANVPIGDIKP